MHDGKVLVVEDEPVILLDLDFALTNAGFNVVATSNAAGVMSTTMEEDIQMARTGEARALGQHRSPVGHRIRPNQGRRVSCATTRDPSRPSVNVGPMLRPRLLRRSPSQARSTNRSICLSPPARWITPAGFFACGGNRLYRPKFIRWRPSTPPGQERRRVGRTAFKQSPPLSPQWRALVCLARRGGLEYLPETAAR